ncbi:hypothetical protein MTO96_040398, partial [Rhipicephalus appendiculatus]
MWRSLAGSGDGYRRSRHTCSKNPAAGRAATLRNRHHRSAVRIHHVFEMLPVLLLALFAS